jgi:putative MFS transporter
VGIPLVAVSAFAFAGFYLGGGAALWALALAGQALGAAGFAALQVYGPELFPTRLRAAANCALAAITVVGSAIGLLAVAALSDGLGLGGSIAVLAVFPLTGLALAAWRFPETRGQELERTSGELS